MVNSKKISLVSGNDFFKIIIIANANTYYIRGNNLGLPSPALGHSALFIYMVRTGRRKRGVHPLGTSTSIYDMKLKTYDSP